MHGFFFQAEDGIRDLVRSRGLGDVYKRQMFYCVSIQVHFWKIKRDLNFRVRTFISKPKLR